MTRNRNRVLLVFALGLVAAYVGWFWFLLRFPHYDVTESCISNLRQCGLALTMYSQDYDDRLPAHANWMDTSVPYLRNEGVYHCPELHRESPNAYGYALSTSLLGRKVSDIPGPSNTPSVFETSLPNRSACSNLSTLPNPPRHDSHKYNVIFYLEGSTFGVSPSGDRKPPEFFKGSPRIGI